jgi:murein DD-endopeptidase MepM/ murein hydrolase activator NlpD
VARFNGKVIHLSPAVDGAVALLGADLNQLPGEYPIELAVIDHLGGTTLLQTALRVVTADRPAEKLTLPPEMVSPRDPAVLKRIAKEQAQLADLFSRNSGPLLWEGFTLPVDHEVGGIFGLRRILNGEPRSPHAGVDFRSPRGTPVRAAAGGTAALAADLYYTGRTVIIYHGEGLFSLYAHLEEILCEEGAFLHRGEILGRVGSTGRSTGPHLHWGVKLRGDRVDPLALVHLLNEQ